MGSGISQPKNLPDNFGSQSSSAVVYQTSIYGWGKLKYPMKQKQSQSTGNNKNGNKNKPFSQDYAGGASDHGPISPSKQIIPTVQNPNGKSLPKPERTLPQHSTKKIPTSTLPKITDDIVTPIIANTGTTGSATEKYTETALNGRIQKISINKENKQPNSTRPTFYGQYRCNSCKKYWRSPHSQEGVAQNCSKCATPTFPRR